MSLDFILSCFRYFASSIAVIITNKFILIVEFVDFLCILDGIGPDELFVSLRIGVELL